MRLELLKEIFLFFARFPSKAGVAELFSQGSSDLPLYAEWKQAVDALPEVAIFPEIKHYIFGSNPQALTERINNISDCFMQIDCGQITSERNAIGAITDSFAIMITVAFPNKKNNSDLMEMSIKSELALDIISRLRNQLYNEERNIPWLKEAMLEHELMPWESFTLMPASGWSILLERKGADMLKMKNEQRT